MITLFGIFHWFGLICSIVLNWLRNDETPVFASVFDRSEQVNVPSKCEWCHITNYTDLWLMSAMMNHIIWRNTRAQQVADHATWKQT